VQRAKPCGTLCQPVTLCVNLLLSLYDIRNYVKCIVQTCVNLLLLVTLYYFILLSHLLSIFIVAHNAFLNS